MASDAAFSGSKIQIAFLGETKRTIPRSRPASGRASRAGLVQDAACGTGAQRRLVLDETEHGAIACPGWATSIVENSDAKSRAPVIPGDRNELLGVTVKQRGVGLRCRPIGQQRLCCDDQLSPPCEPWSEWWITPLGRRVMSAMFRASSTSRVASVVAIDQPTMRRLKASSTTAR